MLKQIMQRLVTADKQRNRTAVLAPKGFVNMMMDKLQELVHVEDSNLFIENESSGNVRE